MEDPLSYKRRTNQGPDRRRNIAKNIARSAKIRRSVNTVSNTVVCNERRSARDLMLLGLKKQRVHECKEELMSQ